MHLKRLEIQGFKSFAEKSVLEFETGITSIVGPNGSGKSNIADGIRWVLGEQSKTLLRGKKAEDVIFVGSSSKSKATTASVSVVFNNEDSIMPIESAEVAITRRIFRDGTSEYLINNEDSRLMDIIDLLGKSGFSQSRYTVIGQGMIDQLLLQGPAEIKAIIEDAAGIAPYYSKKEKTERRLQKVRENLNQISSLVTEIEPRLKSLRRQAKKLQQKSEIEKEWQQLISGRFAYKFDKLNLEKKESTEDINKLEIKINELAKAVEESFGKVAKEDSDSKTRTEKLTALQEKINEKQKTREGLQAKILQVKKESSERDDVYDQQKLQNLKENLEQVENELKKSQEILNNTKNDINEIVEILKTEKPELVTKFKNIIEKFLENQKNFVDNLEKRKLDLENKVSQLDNKKIETKTVEPVISEVALENELEKNRQEISELQTELQQNMEKMSSYGQSRQGLDKDIREKEKELNSLREQKNARQIDLAKTETRLEEEMYRAADSLGDGFKEIISKASPLEDSKIDERVAFLKRQIDQIGGIDEMTLQEYEETEERYNYLSTQLQDLEKASKDLREISIELEEVIKKRFEKAFTIIASKFSEYFRLLFNGGQAEISKMYESQEDMEEELSKKSEAGNKIISGLNIKATPPGKKLSSVASLSGGERTLTSIALLMAILDAFPSPFVVLDEADAALDESNSIRFAKILEQLAKKTQFITITHNRETMRRAHTLYGVTMNDDGISKMLSLKLDESLAFAD